MNGKLIVAILLIAAVSVAQAQNPRVSKADAEKVVTIIRGDKAKTQTYCEIGKLSKQIEQAKDKKMVDELFEKIDKPTARTLGGLGVARPWQIAKAFMADTSGPRTARDVRRDTRQGAGG